MRAGWDARLRSPSLAKLELQVLTVNETERPLAVRNSSTVLKTFKNSGHPENDSGLTGPMVIKENSRLLTSNAECGSRKRVYRSRAAPEEPTSILAGSGRSVHTSLPLRQCYLDWGVRAKGRRLRAAAGILAEPAAIPIPRATRSSTPSSK